MIGYERLADVRILLSARLAEQFAENASRPPEAAWGIAKGHLQSEIPRCARNDDVPERFSSPSSNSERAPASTLRGGPSLRGGQRQPSPSFCGKSPHPLLSRLTAVLAGRRR